MYNKIFIIKILCYWVIFNTLYFSILLSLKILPPGFSWSYSAVLIPLLEITIICKLSLFIYHINLNRKIFQYLSIFPLLFIITLYSLQLFSIYISGDFISLLAIENVGEFKYLPQHAIRLFVICYLAIILFFLIIHYYTIKNNSVNYVIIVPKNISKVFLLCFFIFTSFCILNFIYNKKSITPFNSILSKVLNIYKFSNKINIDETISFIKTFTNLHDYNLRSGIYNQYPLHQIQGKQPSLPFEDLKYSFNQSNIIIIFAEGLPSRAFDYYSSTYKNLTPNFTRFSNYFMRVDNYFNHTAATFRGIQGTLTSQFPYPGGHMPGGWTEPNKTKSKVASRLNKINRQSIVKILNDNNYKSIFLSPHPQEDIFNDMLKGLGYQKVFMPKDYPNFLNRDFDKLIFNGEECISDRDLFTSFINLLKGSEEISEKLFISLYNIGTHCFLDSHPKGVKYLGGQNPALNRFHEYDYCLGLFLDYFFNSPFSKNTFLIITSDHAPHPEPAIRIAFEGHVDYEPYIIDNIPLLIYSPYHILPSIFDANGRTSLDLAPTLLQLLNINNYEHSFMGNTLFIENSKNMINIAATGRKYYQIKGKNVVCELLNNKLPKNVLSNIHLIETFYELENQNRLFKTNKSL